MAMAPEHGPEPDEIAAARSALSRWAAALDERARRLDERARALAEREARLDARAVAAGLDPVEAASTVPAAPLATELRHLMIDTGDDLPTVARGIGLDPEWARAVLDGGVVEVDLAHVQQACEGLQCTPYDLFGPEAARSIAHAYGPDQWPAAIEPLDLGRWSGDCVEFGGPVGPLTDAAPDAPAPELDLGASLDP